MANGHVYSTNPFDGDDDSMEDSVEFRLLMAYATRRRPNKNSPVVQNGASPAEATKENEKTTTKTKTKKKKKKNGLKSLFFKCIKPQTKDGEPNEVFDRCGVVEIPFLKDEEEEEEKEEVKLKEVAGRLRVMAKEIPFTPPEIESDSPQDEVERVIGLLLREAGDKLNEEELKNADLSTALFGKYSFFETVLQTLLKRMGLETTTPGAPGPIASPKTQIAVTCEVTSRLSAVNTLRTLPMNRMIDHGARYLQKYYSNWAEENGGYEEAFDEDDDEVQ